MRVPKFRFYFLRPFCHSKVYILFNSAISTKITAKILNFPEQQLFYTFSRTRVLFTNHCITVSYKNIFLKTATVLKTRDRADFKTGVLFYEQIFRSGVNCNLKKFNKKTGQNFCQFSEENVFILYNIELKCYFFFTFFKKVYALGIFYLVWQIIDAEEVWSNSCFCLFSTMIPDNNDPRHQPK